MLGGDDEKEGDEFMYIENEITLTSTEELQEVRSEVKR